MWICDNVANTISNIFNSADSSKWVNTLVKAVEVKISVEKTSQFEMKWFQLIGITCFLFICHRQELAE